MEDEYNKRFKNNEMSNDNFDAAGLWDSISEELAEPDSNVPSSFPWKLLGGSLLILLVSLGIVYTNADFSTQKVAITSQNKNTENNTAHNSNQAKKTTNSSSAKGIEANEKTVIKNAPSISNNTDNQSLEKIADTDTEITRPKIADTLKSAPSPQMTTALTEYSVTKNTKILSQKNISSHTLKSNKTASESLQKSKKFIQATTKEEEDFSNKFREDKKKLLLDELEKRSQLLPEILPSLSDSLLIAGLRKSKSTWDKRVKEASKKERKTTFAAGAYGSINRTSFKYQSASISDFANQRNTTESPVFGSTYGLDATISRKGWHINTGVELQNIWTKFATNLQVDTSIFQSQVLSLVRIDGTTGNTINTVRQDTIVNAVENRTIVHYNQFRVLSLPLQIGRYRTHKKWSYGISAGTSFNFLLNQSGKILNTDNTILVFNENSKKVGFQGFSMSLRANLFVAYQLNKNLFLHLSPQWSRSVHNIQEYEMQAKVQQTNIVLGLRSIF